MITHLHAVTLGKMMLNEIRKLLCIICYLTYHVVNQCTKEVMFDSLDLHVVDFPVRLE